MVSVFEYQMVVLFCFFFLKAFMLLHVFVRYDDIHSLEGLNEDIELVLLAHVL